MTTEERIRDIEREAAEKWRRAEQLRDALRNNESWARGRFSEEDVKELDEKVARLMKKADELRFRVRMRENVRQAQTSA